MDMRGQYGNPKKRSFMAKIKAKLAGGYGRQHGHGHATTGMGHGHGHATTGMGHGGPTQLAKKGFVQKIKARLPGYRR